MEKLTKERAVQLHRELWTSIAEGTRELQNPVGKVTEMTSMGFDVFDVFNQCFCCEYAVNAASQQQIMCDACPLCWPDGMCTVDTYDSDGKCHHTGLYDLWYDAYRRNDWRQAAFFATQIANLPEK